jgi:flagellar motor switch protein FliN/FliY
MAEKNSAAATAAQTAPDPKGASAEVSLDLILDVDVTLALEVGRTRIKVRDLLQLSQGSILELDRLAGEPLDVLVNGVQVARGEVVVVNDNFGLRLTEVVSPRERIEPLK